MRQLKRRKGYSGKLRPRLSKEWSDGICPKRGTRERFPKLLGEELLHTRRSQVDWILDPKHDLTFSSFSRASALLGHRVLGELV